MAEETLWQTTTGAWDQAASWTNGVPSLGVEPTVARFPGGDLSQMDVRLGLTGAECQRLITMPGYRGKIGSVDSPLEIEIGNRCVLRGRGAHNIKFDVSSFAVVICDSENLAGAGLLTGSISRIGVKSGRWILGSTAILSQQVVVDGPRADVLINAAAASENMAPVVVTIAGKLINERPSDSGNYKLVYLGGSVVQKGPLLTGDLVVTSPSCSFSYEPSSEPATAPQIILAGGFNDFRDAGYQFGVDKLIIGRLAEVEGSTIEAGGYPPGSLTAPVDLREEYP